MQGSRGSTHANTFCSDFKHFFQRLKTLFQRASSVKKSDSHIKVLSLAEKSTIRRRKRRVLYFHILIFGELICKIFVAHEIFSRT